MGKRSKNGQGGGKSKRSKVVGIIDPNTSGVYATCNRGKEQQCRKELMNLFTEKIETYFDLSQADAEADVEAEDGDGDGNGGSMSIEDQIQKELADLNQAKSSSTQLLTPIELGCECLVFIKTRKPVVPETLVERIVEECYNTSVKTTRYTQKLTPITFSVSPTVEEIRKLAKRVLEPHFHTKDQKPYKFAIQVSRRNFNVIPKDTIIKTIAECVGRDHGHKVDLKDYDKLIMVECYKSNLGMSVVNNYLKYEKYNLQQIFDKSVDNENTTNDGKSKTDNKQVPKNDSKNDCVDDTKKDLDNHNNGAKSDDSKTTISD
jgi:tRNA acetyltransferase TAN1